MSIKARGEPSGAVGRLRGTALIMLLAGAVGSIGFMLRAGHRQNSRILPLLFGIWVLSPFVAVAYGHTISKRWTVVTRVTLYILMLVLTLGSLAIYGSVAFGYSKMKVGFVFLVVPLVSWLLVAVVPIAAFISARLSRVGDRA